MTPGFNGISKLANSVGEKYFKHNVVNLASIADSENILVIYSDYNDKNGKNYFLGQLYHEAGEFFIHMNVSPEIERESGRVRFTLAHELGHYFIPSHRKKLLKGISLSFKGNPNDKAIKQIEKEADHFAANLLMPKTLFIKLSEGLEPGLNQILKLKDNFATSIESTAIQYIKLNFNASILIRWDKDFKVHHGSYSQKFSKRTGVTGIPPIKDKSVYIQQQVQLIENNSLPFIEQATTISSWISTVLPDSKKDSVGLEQTIKLGEFGGITLLIF